MKKTWKVDVKTNRIQGKIGSLVFDVDEMGLGTLSIDGKELSKYVSLIEIKILPFQAPIVTLSLFGTKEEVSL